MNNNPHKNPLELSFYSPVRVYVSTTSSLLELTIKTSKAILLFSNNSLPINYIQSSDFPLVGSTFSRALFQYTARSQDTEKCQGASFFNELLCWSLGNYTLQSRRRRKLELS